MVIDVIKVVKEVLNELYDGSLGFDDQPQLELLCLAHLPKDLNSQ